MTNPATWPSHTLDPRCCPQDHTAPLSTALCLANIDLEAAPCLRCLRGQEIARANTAKRRADAARSSKIKKPRMGRGS
jgi:hypothetical protein